MSNPVPPPGLQYPTLPANLDGQTVNYVKNIFDNLFWLRGQLRDLNGDIQQAAESAAARLINQAITNITNSVTNIFNSTGLFLVGTHNTRLTAYGGVTQAIGTGFFETDRNVIYVITGTPKKWEFAAGLMLGAVSSRPADLGIYDASFLFFATDELVLYVWDGTSWLAISSDVQSAGYWSPLTNGIPDAPELVFDTLANCVVVWTATP